MDRKLPKTDKLLTKTGESEISRALAADFPRILKFLELVEDWMHERGIEQWPQGCHRKDSAELKAYIDQQHWYLVERSDQLQAMVLLKDSDQRWKDHDPKASALYLHKLTVHPKLSGQGLGLALLRWCEQQSRAVGKDYLRLDCWARNERLKEYYRSAGYQDRALVKDKIWELQLYELRLE